MRGLEDSQPNGFGMRLVENLQNNQKWALLCVMIGERSALPFGVYCSSAIRVHYVPVGCCSRQSSESYIINPFTMTHHASAEAKEASFANSLLNLRNCGRRCCKGFRES
jgi:hypothetical protein